MIGRFVRWCVLLLGGALIGAGLELQGLVAIARHMQDEVDHTPGLFRAIGRLTMFLLRDDANVALAVAKVPRELVDELARSGWVLIGVGGLIALTAPMLRARNGKAKD